jgi:ABC-type amino acid transport substrate-binding protein
MSWWINRRVRNRTPIAWALMLTALFTCAGPADMSDTRQADDVGRARDVEHEGPQLFGSFAADVPIEEWTGDLDGMVERRSVRALVAYSKTFYFLDGGTQRGLTYEALKEFEKYLNTQLGRRTLKVNVTVIPVHRDELLPVLTQGLGDIAAANLTITPERQQLVDSPLRWRPACARWWSPAGLRRN